MQRLMQRAACYMIHEQHLQFVHAISKSTTHCTLQLHLTVSTEGNVNSLYTFALQLLSLCAAQGRYYDVCTANHAVCVTSCCLRCVVLSHPAYITDGDLHLPVY